MNSSQHECMSTEEELPLSNEQYFIVPSKFEALKMYY